MSENAEEIAELLDVSSEWLEWYQLSPEERWKESQKLWVTYLEMGGSLEPEVDFQSPFYLCEDYKAFHQVAP